MQNEDNDKNISSDLVLKPPPNLNSSFNQFNNSSQTYDFKDPKNVVKSKYYNLEEVQAIKIPNTESSLSLFHITVYEVHRFPLT